MLVFVTEITGREKQHIVPHLEIEGEEQHELILLQDGSNASSPAFAKSASIELAGSFGKSPAAPESGGRYDLAVAIQAS